MELIYMADQAVCLMEAKSTMSKCATRGPSVKHLTIQHMW
jgi:hypothetical protein